MGKLLLFLSTYKDLLSLLSTLAVALATIYYVHLTRKLLLETKKSREEQTQPFVLADIEIFRDKLVLVIKNVGNGPARNVKITSAPEIHNSLNSIEFMAPNKELYTLIDYTFFYFAETKFGTEKCPDSYEVYVEYEDVSGNLYNENYNIDLVNLSKTYDINNTDLKVIAENTKKIEKNIKDLSKSTNDIKQHQKIMAESLKHIKTKIK